MAFMAFNFSLSPVDVFPMKIETGFERRATSAKCLAFSVSTGRCGRRMPNEVAALDQ